MKITQFIEATSAKDLTEQVQAAEREGWEYVGMQATIAPQFQHDGKPVAPPFSHMKVLIAVMQREETAPKQLGTREAFEQAEPFQAPGAFGKSSF